MKKSLLTISNPEGDGLFKGALNIYVSMKKIDFIILFFTLMMSLFLIAAFNFIVVELYKVSEEQILSELAGVYLEKYRFGLWPEPVEQLQFLLTILAAPISIIVTYKFCKNLLKIIPIRKLNVIYYTSFALSVIQVLTLIYLDLKLDPGNFVTEGHQFFYRDIRTFVSVVVSDGTIWLALLLFPVALYFVMLDAREKLSRIESAIFGAIILAVLLAAFVINLSSRDNYFGGYDHFNAVYYSLVQVVNGKTLLVDFTNQYGLYPHFLSPIFSYVQLTPFSYSLVMSSLVILSYLILLLFLIKSIRDIRLALLGFVGLIWLRQFFLIAFNYGDSYFQYTPIRFIFPCLLLLLASIYFKSLNKKLYYTIFVISSISILWNVDSGVVVFLAWLATLCFNDLFNYDVKGALRKCLIHVAHGFAIISAVALSYAIWMYLRSGSFPDFSLLIKYQKIFYQTGFFMMHMPAFNAWNLLALIYAIGLVKSVKSLLENDKSQRNTVIFLISILGIGVFSYYQGRSHDFNLFLVNYPAFILLIIFVDDLLGWVRSNGFRIISKVFYLSLSLLFMLIIASHLIIKLPFIYELAGSRLSFLVKNVSANLSLTQNILFLKDNVKKGESILILPEPGYLDGIYYGETETANAVNVPGFSELVRQEDFDNIVNFLKSNVHAKVFIDSRFNEGLVLKVLSDNYILLDQNDDMKLYLPRAAAQELLRGNYVEGSAKCHLHLHEEVLVSSLENFPVRPMASIQIELTGSINLKEISISADNGLGGDLGRWTTLPISHLWGIGIVDNELLSNVRNSGRRKMNLNLEVGRSLILLIPDNGNLSSHTNLSINIKSKNYGKILITTSCN